jgi:hypothetical protein
VFAWIKDKSLYCSVRENRWELQAKMQPGLGNCFAYDNDKPRPAVHKEKLGHTLSLNMRCEVIHDGEIFPNHGRPDLACVSSRAFFWLTTGNIEAHDIWSFVFARRAHMRNFCTPIFNFRCAMAIAIACLKRQALWCNILLLNRSVEFVSRYCPAFPMCEMDKFVHVVYKSLDLCPRDSWYLCDHNTPKIVPMDPTHAHNSSSWSQRPSKKEPHTNNTSYTNLWMKSHTGIDPLDFLGLAVKQGFSNRTGGIH